MAMQLSGISPLFRLLLNAVRLTNLKRLAEVDIDPIIDVGGGGEYSD